MREQTTVNPSVTTERRGRVLVVTLNRPEKKNAINLSMAQGIADAMDHLDADDELLVGVITGAGGTFSAGMDLAAFAEGELPHIEGRGFAGITQRGPDKPVIAAIEGFAVAGGFEIALSCDLLVAARDARFGIPEVNHSLIALGGALLRLPRRMPYHAVMELALTGELVKAETLARFGVLNRLTEPGDALPEALELADRVADSASLAVRATKEILERQWNWATDEAWLEQAKIADPVIGSDEAREGARAFGEKRRPNWRAE